jgi:hypothetical protein
MRHADSQLTELMQESIAACQACHEVCLETMTHCLGHGGPHAAPQHIAALLDCAESCRLSADFMLRDSHLSGRACGFCAEVCLRCAESCEQFGDDVALRRCAELCRQCAQICRRMAHTELAA